MAKKILLTGSSGFLGAAVAARLVAEGHAVLGLDPVRPPAGIPYRHLHEDLSSEPRLAATLAEFQPDLVIHAGGVSGPMVLANQPARVMAINLGGSLNLLQASLAAGVGRFVFCSSTSAIGEFTHGPIPDDEPMRPNTTYGASKAAMDQALAGLHGRCGTTLVSLRFTAVYGPGRKTAMPIGEIVAAAIAGRSIRVPVQPPWPYVFIDDAVEATLRGSFCDAAGLRRLFYHIAHPELVSLPDVAAALALQGLPVQVLEDGALPAVARGPLTVVAAEQELGFRAVIDHHAGIARMIAAAR
ncbi:MAG: NAD(P)-dependent oxidoreductase [Roseococcus sp.]|nr:NAD(P)-dependent oxidoreductase [Roseococcus sp.]